jgi:hypothetical protein
MKRKIKQMFNYVELKKPQQEAKTPGASFTILT